MPQYQQPWFQPNNIPVIKNYKIYTSGPLEKHADMAILYEDILPTKQFPHTHNTMRERLAIHNYVRSVLVRTGDGEDISLDDGDNSLMRYIKIMELNPYGSDELSLNPYKSLPDDMLIYRSCYPIRYDSETGSVACAKNSVGINVRIYKMTFGEYHVNKTKANYHDFDLWREVAYYEFIREQILKRKVCPNFVTMYAYYIYEKCSINFDELKALKDEEDITKYRYKAVKSGPRDRTGLPLFADYPVETILGAPHVTVVGKDDKMMDDVEYEDGARDASEIDIYDHPDAYSGRALVVLTESPDHSLYTWASRVYMAEGKIRRMVSTGYHDDKVWFSVLFQVMAAMYVMQINQIYIGDFSVENNVYIKDVSYHDKAVNFWKYCIDGVDYYIPNYGYVAMIDTNFKKPAGGGYSILSGPSTKHYKIVSNMFRNQTGADYYDENDLEKVTFDAFRNVFTPNTFSRRFVNNGGNKPSDNVCKLLSEIENDINHNPGEYDIGSYLRKHMTRLFVHNRVGTRPTVDERPRIDDSPVAAGDHKEGRLYANTVSADDFRYVIFLDYTDATKANCVIVTKDNPDDEFYVRETVASAQLRECLRYEPLKQNYVPGYVNLAETELLESYRINRK